jgi:hypothetical protein
LGSTDLIKLFNYHFSVRTPRHTSLSVIVLIVVEGSQILVWSYISTV